jgi:short-subunit dehydrogenase
VFEVNIKAPTQLIHAVLPSFLSRPGSPKVIITVGSSSADLPLPFLTAYTASKAGIVKTIQILDMELREKGIFNYLIHPGNIKSTSLTHSSEATVGQEMKDMLDGFKKSGAMDDTTALPADSMVALAALSQGNEKERIGVLSGRYWDVQDDLEELLAQQEGIQKRGLYQLRVRRL